ncbi:MAG: hypothetical protein PHQ58_09660 [Rhodoferax sp.]|uniref:hypothetical protein n=1 Tax=Rhodoferax sp. TaxID=50421 RepID=UPI002638D4F8|nr:hypothetical protein [Rhodoferax sp.]MDD2880694.1 hypothetical protein [Rhodoferax sp.]
MELDVRPIERTASRHLIDLNQHNRIDLSGVNSAGQTKKPLGHSGFFNKASPSQGDKRWVSKLYVWP